MLRHNCKWLLFGAVEYYFVILMCSYVDDMILSCLGLLLPILERCMAIKYSSYQHKQNFLHMSLGKISKRMVYIYFNETANKQHQNHNDNKRKRYLEVNILVHCFQPTKKLKKVMKKHLVYCKSIFSYTKSWFIFK